jgi:superfamily II DNA or RNA helicase
MANRKASGYADITVASVQSLISKDRLSKYDPEFFKLLLIDEAHHAAASSYMNVLKYFGADTLNTLVNVIGVSATLSRFDGLKLGAALDYIAYHKDYIDMIGESW